MRATLVALTIIGVLAAGCASDDTTADDGAASAASFDECDWPMFGNGPERRFATTCEGGISSETVADLHRVWFFNTSDVVTAAPIVVENTLFVGDWAGTFYAVDSESGEEIWHTELDVHPQVYAGQITASAAAATIAGEPAVVVNAGRTTYALAAPDGRELWRNARGEENSPTEIEGAPVVVEDTVVIGYDVHNNPLPAGVVAIDVATGEDRWWFDLEQGDHAGCGDVWSSPSVDLERRMVFAGSANCPPSPDHWGPYTEALFAVDLDSGDPVWSFQPHESNNEDADFAGAPNLFTVDGRDLVGLGNKDAAYYAVDRETGELVWKTQATGDGYISHNYSSGGFIGPTAVGDDVIVGATAVGDCPCMHALDPGTGAILWQQPAVGPSYAPTTIVGDLAFVGTLDFTLRALALTDGEVLWSDSLTGLISGGVASIGDDLWAVSGFREPGSPGPSETSGVFRYTVDPDIEALDSATTSTTTVAVDETIAVRLVGASGPCIGAPCDYTFQLKDPPDGVTDPAITVAIEPDPFTIEVTVSGLGDPRDWLLERSTAAGVGASSYGVLVSERDDDPTGGFLCVIEPDETGSGSCTGAAVPSPGASYSRISVLALDDSTVVPGPEDGFARLVDTMAFDPPLQSEIIE